jgi:hypothetical protein
MTLCLDIAPQNQAEHGPPFYLQSWKLGIAGSWQFQLSRYSLKSVAISSIRHGND